MLFLIKNLKTPAANILKQDALSIGAEVAVPWYVAGCKKEFCDALLMGSQKQLEELAKKEAIQPYGLRELSVLLKTHLKGELSNPVEIMGVLNTNLDSFYEKSRKNGKEAIEKIVSMIDDGATIIDVGAVSSRPGSEWVATDEELSRLGFIVEEIYKNRLYENARFSIDTINPTVAEFCLDRGFCILNDIDGLANPKNAETAARYSASVVIMHKKGEPKNMQQEPTYEDVILEVDDFFRERIEVAKSFGVKDIILDVGIGFGKSLEHNLLLIKHLIHFKHFGFPLLLGASRKSMIDKISPSSVEERLGGTLALHLEGIKNGASIIRAHDVYEHKQALTVMDALKETKV